MIYYTIVLAKTKKEMNLVDVTLTCYAIITTKLLRHDQTRPFCLLLVISNTRYYCLLSCAIQILIRSVKHHKALKEAKKSVLEKNEEQKMEAHTKQQMVDNKELFMHYYCFITDPI